MINKLRGDRSPIIGHRLPEIENLTACGTARQLPVRRLFLSLEGCTNTAPSA